MKTFITPFLCLGLVTSFAQTQLLDTAVVSASRFNTSLQGSNRNVIVIKGKEISNAPVQSISDLLDFAIGIDSRQRGTFGTQTDLSIRGGTFEQVLVLLNGVRLSDPQTGHHLMNLPVQKSDIERIEVLLGGGSYIFGGSAFSGAVNIITKSAKKEKAIVDIAAGSYGSYQAGYTQRLPGKNHQTTFSVNRTASDGFKENTDFERTNLFAQSQIQIDSKKINLSGGYSWQNFGAQNFYSDAYPEQYEKTRTLFLNAGLQSGEKVKIDRQIYWRRNWDEFQLFREGEDFYQYEDGLFIKGSDTAATWYTGHNYHRSDVLGGKLETKFSTAAGQTSVGGEYRYESVLSNNLGENLEAPINIEGSRGMYTLGQSRHNISVAIEQAKKIGRLDFSAALLVNYNSSYNTDLYPALTAGYNFNRQHKLYGSFNRSFRLPSYTDLYYRLGGAVGSKDLRPENSLNYEIGYKFLSEKFYFNLSAFRRQGTNIIDWIQECDTCDLLASNTSKVNFNGADFSFRWMKASFLDLFKMDFVELGYSHLFTDKEQFDYESLYVFDYLKNKATLRIQHSILKNLKFSYGLSYQDRNGSYTDSESGAIKEYEDVVLLNARIGYSWPYFDVYVSGQNLLNRTYYDRGNVELPGAWIWTGLKVSL